MLSSCGILNYKWNGVLVSREIISRVSDITYCHIHAGPNLAPRDYHCEAFSERRCEGILSGTKGHLKFLHTFVSKARPRRNRKRYGSLRVRRS